MLVLSGPRFGACDCQRCIQSREWRRRGHRLSCLLKRHMVCGIIGLCFGLLDVCVCVPLKASLSLKFLSVVNVRKKAFTPQASFMEYASLMRCRGMEEVWQAVWRPCAPKLPSSPSRLRPAVTGGCCRWWIAARARIWHLPYMMCKYVPKPELLYTRVPSQATWSDWAAGFGNFSHVTEFILHHEFSQEKGERGYILNYNRISSWCSILFCHVLEDFWK